MVDSIIQKLDIHQGGSDDEDLPVVVLGVHRKEEESRGRRVISVGIAPDFLAVVELNDGAGGIFRGHLGGGGRGANSRRRSLWPFGLPQVLTWKRALSWSIWIFREEVTSPSQDIRWKISLSGLKSRE
jgi:hypothetical protein